MTPQGLCPRFRVAQAAQGHRPALLLQADFPEPGDLHSRVLWLIYFYCGVLGKACFMEGIGKKKRKQMSMWWFILILGIWILLQAYILPKLGIST
jgi:hypothetical protein